VVTIHDVEETDRCAVCLISASLDQRVWMAGAQWCVGLQDRLAVLEKLHVTRVKRALTACANSVETMESFAVQGIGAMVRICASTMSASPVVVMVFLAA